eukprot:485340-Prymnesium_polylepis.2
MRPGRRGRTAGALLLHDELRRPARLGEFGHEGRDPAIPVSGRFQLDIHAATPGNEGVPAVCGAGEHLDRIVSLSVADSSPLLQCPLHSAARLEALCLSAAGLPEA